MEIVLDRYPVENIGAIAMRDNAAAAWVAQSGLLYEVDAAAGILSLPGPLGSRWMKCQVLYTGGYVLPGATAEAGQTALPADLESACLDQVAYWYQNRHSLRIADLDGKTSPTRGDKSTVLLPVVEEILKGYKRILV